MQPASAPSRRLTSRVQVPGDVWVYWRCHGQEDVSLVQNMSMGGLFLETQQERVPGDLAKLHFLAQEGQIRADAVVCHIRAGAGLGLKFTALRELDRPKLAALLTRLRKMQQFSGRS